tara:strand:+ start:4712 stop:4819 length:108 start_codon:yes stop_codon:yes gene_type:complete
MAPSGSVIKRWPELNRRPKDKAQGGISFMRAFLET